MAQQRQGAVGEGGRCSPLEPMARALRPCIVSPPTLVILPMPTATELIRKQHWCYWPTRCMGQHLTAAGWAMGSCSPSTLMALVLGHCIILPAQMTEPLQMVD